MSICVTGASGNVGKYLVDALLKDQTPFIIASRRPLNSGHELIENRILDLTDVSTYDQALKDVSSLFLVRPPQITDVEGVFKPFIEACQKNGVEHIVFLSLLGVEKNPFPPHHKIEKLIEGSQIAYTFLRPSFFMQNLIEPHKYEIIRDDEIYIPSGKAKISFIDTKDIGEVACKALIDHKHRNKKYTLTGSEAIDYKQVAEIMTEVLNRPITYKSPNLFKFRSSMLKRGEDKTFVNVMMVLYITTRLGMANHVTYDLQMILNRKARSIKQFIQRNKDIWH